jgi:chemotaxis response regulator CheB
MVTTASPCRTYILYHHGLFAQGVCSMLKQYDSVQIIGMERNADKALTAVRSLRPDVILVEEAADQGLAWPFLQHAGTGRVVTLSLAHACATVYDQRRIAANDPGDLLQIIQAALGSGEPNPAAVSRVRHPDPTMDSEAARYDPGLSRKSVRAPDRKKAKRSRGDDHASQKPGRCPS